MAMFDFHWRDGEFEVRTTCGLGDKPYVELVHWYEDNGREFCYSIAYWYKGNEGWSLRFVGDRMLELANLDIGKIWAQLCAAQISLSAWYDRQVELT